MRVRIKNIRFTVGTVNDELIKSIIILIACKDVDASENESTIFKKEANKILSDEIHDYGDEKKS